MLISTEPTQLGCCDGCNARLGMGFTSTGAANDSNNWLRNLLPIPVDGDWIQPLGTIALAAIAAFLAYKMLFGNRGKNRRKELADARKDYTAKVSEIKQKWAY